MSDQFIRGGRLQGLVAAYRFARIPFICAAFIALISPDPVGRTIAIALAVLVVVTGLVLNGRVILFGRKQRLPSLAPTTVEHRRAA